MPLMPLITSIRRRLPFIRALPTRALKAAARPIFDFCYPGRCAACEADCPGSQTLCDGCGMVLRALASAPVCEYCALPIGQHGDPCPHCKGKGVAHYERIIRLGTFEDPIRSLIHHVKYHGHWPYAEFLADCLLEQEPVRGILHEAELWDTVLLPVPLHRLRQIARGFNQAEVLARRIGKKTKIPVVRPAVRLRNTEAQTDVQSKAQRAENLRDAFGLLNPGAIEGKHVVVIDDVKTTGSTLQSLARTLNEAKPASLSAIVVAVADPKGRSFESS